MKATIKTTIMLMAMTIGTLAASAQSAQRGTPHNEQQRKTASTANARSQRSQAVKKNDQPAQQVTKRTTSRENNAVRSTATRQEPNRQLNSRSGARNNNAVRSTATRQEPSRQVNTRSNAQKSTATRSSSSRQEPNRQVTSRTTNQKSQAYRGNNGRHSGTPASQQNARLQNSNRKVSTTTRNNSRSDYRTPNRSVNAGKTHLDPKPRATENRNAHVVVDRNHNSSSHAHHRNYYPAKKVKLHVHPRTYHNHYKVMYYPSHREIIWTSRMHRYYVDLYPGYIWRYNIGYHIQTISAFETRYNVGEVARVYGRVYATWYNRESDDLLLFFGGEFPYQEFTMVVPGHIARRYNWRPERYFLGQHVLATGLITSYDGSPEMIIRNKSQIDIY
jgi:hypothetical protein